MESPVKKLDFSTANKENQVMNQAGADTTELKTNMAQDVKKDEKAVVTTKAPEIDEPILQENPNRFVLFPIKYHEVRAQRVIHA